MSRIEQRASERITEEVTSWPGSQRAREPRRVRIQGGWAGDRPPPRRPRRALRLSEEVWHALFAEGASTITRSSRVGRASVREIESDADVDDVIALMRLNYDRVVDRHGLPAEAAA